MLKNMKKHAKGDLLIHISLNKPNNANIMFFNSMRIKFPKHDYIP